MGFDIVGDVHGHADKLTAFFFGHHCRTSVPAPLTSHVAHGAGLGVPLAAYHWDGEPVLQARNFVGDAGS